MIEPSVEFIYPEDEDDMFIPENVYREVSFRYLRVMNIWMDYLLRAESKKTAMWATAYTLGLAVCEGVSITDRALMLDISPQALSKAIREFQDQLNIPKQSYTYDKRANKRQSSQ